MKRLLFFIFLTALSLLVCIATFASLAWRDSSVIIQTLAINFPLCLLLCVTYYYVISRFSRVSVLQRNSVLRIVVDWLCATTLGVALNVVARHVIGVDVHGSAVTLTFLLWNTMAVLGVELYVYHSSVLEKETQLARLEKEKVAYQFEALKQQINPHFLFNNLNALASLAYQDAEKTNLFAKKLSSVYRYLLLTADKQMVSLSDELTFLNSYLYLENIRFGKAMKVSINIPDSLKSKRIVPACLQLLVENALKHNIATENNPLNVNISVNNDMLTIENNLQPRGDVASNKKGLKNLSRQYEACGKHIEIEKSQSTFVVKIPLE